MVYTEDDINKAIEKFSAQDLSFAQLANQYAKFKIEGYNNEKLSKNEGKRMGHSFTVLQVSGWLDTARDHLKKTSLSQEELLKGTHALYQLAPEKIPYYEEFFDIVFKPQGRGSYNANINQDDLYELDKHFRATQAQKPEYKYSDKLIKYAEERHLVLA